MHLPPPKSYSWKEDEVFDGYFEKLGIAPSHAKPLTGYTTWYSMQQDLSEKKLFKAIEDISSVSARFPCQLFCLDEGYERAVGDWLVPRKNAFPHGIYPITKKIMKAGMQAGMAIGSQVASALNNVNQGSSFTPNAEPPKFLQDASHMDNHAG